MKPSPTTFPVPPPYRRVVADPVLHDRPVRSILKSLSWRIVGSIDTILLATLLTGGLIGTATKIGITEVLSKTLFYFLHERAWSFAALGQSSKDSPRARKGRVLRRPSENVKRSAVKTATWRVLASLDTMLLSWFFTGSLALAATIGSVEIFTKLFLYYVHERFWARIRYGTEVVSRHRLPRAVSHS